MVALPTRSSQHGFQSSHFIPPEFNFVVFFRYTFLAFGHGPRSCVGQRFAMLEAKMALAAVFRKFTLVKCKKTVEKIELDPSHILGGNIGGIWLKAIPRNET